MTEFELHTQSDADILYIRYQDQEHQLENYTLDSVRELSRETGDPTERIDLLNADLHCSNCKKEIADRFSANFDGDILCWTCAMEGSEHEESGVVHNTDPAKVILGESGLYHKSLCDYVINVATGCRHGCKFCYVPSTPNITAREDMLEAEAGVENGQQDWGSYLLYRDDLPERLSRKLQRKRKWKRTERGRGMVMFSSGTDCYQDRRTAQITRGCVSELVKRKFPVRILTRSPVVTRDIDLFKKAVDLGSDLDGELIRVGSSIPCLDDEQVRAIEPKAPAPSARLRALRTLSDEGIPVYVSMSPTYPTQSRSDFDNLLSEFADIGVEVVFHEPINPRGGNFNMTIEAAKEAGQTHLAEELHKIKTDRSYWVDYSLKQMSWAEELGKKHGVDIHIWPDKQVVKSIDSSHAERLESQRQAVSPENVPDIPLPS